jgi:cytochrome c
VQGWSVSDTVYFSFVAWRGLRFCYGCCCRCNSKFQTQTVLTATFTTSTGDRVQRGEEMLRTWVIAGIAVAASTGPTLGQDAAAGEQVFKRLCSPCHDIGQDAKIKIGPPLNGIDGRKSGTFEGFNYSPANKSSGITWSEETFPKYIRAPMQEMSGTRMAFVGIKNDKDIADLWAYLKKSGADGAKN